MNGHHSCSLQKLKKCCMISLVCLYFQWNPSKSCPNHSFCLHHVSSLNIRGKRMTAFPSAFVCKDDLSLRRLALIKKCSSKSLGGWIWVWVDGRRCEKISDSCEMLNSCRMTELMTNSELFVLFYVSYWWSYISLFHLSTNLQHFEVKQG